MKVGMVAFGCQDYTVALTNALARHCNVDLYIGEYALRQRDPSLLEALDGGARVQRFGPFRIRDPRNLLAYSRLCRMLRNGHYDVIHFQSSATPWIAPFWRTFRDVPLVVTIHDPYQHPGLPFFPTFCGDVMQRICVRRARKIIVHGRLLKEQVLERYHAKSAGDVVVLPHGDLAVAKRWDHEGRDECGGEKKILFFGAARPNKGLRYLLRAEPLLRGRLEHYRVVVAGECGDFSRFHRYVEPGARLEVINRFISNQELPGLFREAAVVVLPYTSASQSGIISLAYTFGKPVVATRVGALPEAVIDGITGLLAEPGDEQSLADALVTLLSNDGLREEMGRNALKYCREHLSWDAIARRTVQVYAELLGRGAARGVRPEDRNLEDREMSPGGAAVEPARPTTADDAHRPRPRWRSLIRACCREALGILLRFTGASSILWRPICRRRATILVYHDPAPEVLEKHLAYLASRYTFISLRRLVRAMQDHDWHDMPLHPLVVTFDDGYRGNRRLLDSIRRWKVRPTIFLCSDIVNTRRHFWWKAGYERPEELKRLPHQDLLERLRREIGFEPEKEQVERQALSLSELREMAPHVDFGSHTRFHPILVNCTDEACRDEIVGSKQRLEELLGQPISDFAYPNGDGNGRERRFVADAAYQSARTLDIGWNDLRSDRMRLRAMPVDDDASINVLCAQMCGGFGRIHGWMLRWLRKTPPHYAERP